MDNPINHLIVTPQQMTNQFISMHQSGNQDEANLKYHHWLQATLEIPAGRNTPTFSPAELPTSSLGITAEEQRRLVDVLNQHTFPNTREDEEGRAEAHRSYLEARHSGHSRNGLFKPYGPADDTATPTVLGWFHIGFTPRTLFAYKQGAYLVDEFPTGAELRMAKWDPELCEPADLNLWKQSAVDRLFALSPTFGLEIGSEKENQQLLEGWMEQHVTFNGSRPKDGVTVRDAVPVFRYAEENEFGHPRLYEVWMDPFTKNLYRRVTSIKIFPVSGGASRQVEESWSLCRLLSLRTESFYVLFPKGDNPHTNPARYTNFTRPQYTRWPADFQGAFGSI